MTALTTDHSIAALIQAMRTSADWLSANAATLTRDHEPALAGGDSLQHTVLIDALRVIGYRLRDQAVTGLTPVTCQVADIDPASLLIDARSPREYQHDHIPGALSAPVVDNDEYAAVGTLHRTDTHAAYLRGVAWSLRRMADDLPRVLAAASGRAITVYCFRGGKRSRLWCNVLLRAGCAVRRVDGGWKAYRKTVVADLAAWPQRFHYLVLCGPTGCGKTRLLQALAQRGEQVLDLEGLAAHRGSLIGGLPSQAQPSQKAFDSALRSRLSQFDRQRPVWIEAESKKIGQLQLPDALPPVMRAGAPVYIDMALDDRVTLWHADYRNLADDPIGMVDALQPAVALVSREIYAHWQDCARRGDTRALFASVMTHYYDPLYRRSLAANYPALANAPVVTISSAAPEAIDQACVELLALTRQTA